MEIFDITRTLSPTIKEWPGDQPFEYGWTAQMGKDSVVNIGRISLSTHVGTHADAPLHYISEGISIDQVPLSHFFGDAFVIEIRKAEAVTPKHLKKIEKTGIKRVLFKTKSSQTQDDVWDPHFVHILPETIDELAKLDVVLVGTDAPSLDPVDSKHLPAHKRLAKYRMVILENLVFSGVPDGQFLLVAFPLKLKGLDAAPVRAVLVR